jgi:hypothetical protein
MLPVETTGERQPLRSRLPYGYILALRHCIAPLRGGTMDRVELRPLSLGELLDRTFTLYRGHFWLFVGIMAIPSAFAIPMNAFLLAMQKVPSATGKVSPGAVAGIITGYFVFLLFFVTVYALATAAATSAVSNSYLGQDATVRGSYGKVRGYFWRVVGVVLNIWLRVVGIVFLFVFVVAGVTMAIAVVPSGFRPGPGFAVLLAIGLMLVYLAIAVALGFILMRYAVAVPALVLEGLGVLEAIRRSVHLTRGRRGQIFVAFILMTVIAYIGAMVFQGPFIVAMLVTAKNPQMAPWLAFSMSVSGAIGGSLTGPLLMIVLVLCYYDSRIRKEAFDLQYMMASLERPAAGSVSPA